MAKYDNIFEEVLKIPISEVFFKYGFQPRRCGSSWQLPSPFRNDSSSTSFTLSDGLNIFKDWVARDIKGNSINFVQRYYNLTYFEACMDIALKFGIITEDAYKKILSRKPNHSEIKHYETTYKMVEKPKHLPAEPEVLDKVYRIFISFTTLSEAHLEHLKVKRNLSVDEIKEHMFFTMPTRGMVRRFLKAIEAEFGSQDVLADVPGFFKRAGEQNFSFNASKGIGLPIFNENRLIVGIQIRLDELNKSGLRYFWFSSGFADNDTTGQFEVGTSSGSPIDVVFPTKLNHKGVFITEGKFKAIKLAETFHCICLSVQGVSTWKPIINLLSNLGTIVNRDYPKFGGDWKIQMIYSAFDADMCKNINVYKQLFNMTNKILEEVPSSVRGSSFNVQYMFWDVNLGKGIDDLINSSTLPELGERLKRYNKVDFDNAYKNLIDKILEETKLSNESEICMKLSCDEFESYFDKYFKI